jgi:hypothetical protein
VNEKANRPPVYPMELIPENDSIPERSAPKIVVRVVQAPNMEAWCFLCGAPIENPPGPGLFLKGGRERACKACARIHEPIALNELKWRRRDWDSESDWSR